MTNYVIEYRDTKSIPWSKAGDVSADKTFFVADRLLTGNYYYFRVIAFNEEGQGPRKQSDQRNKKTIGTSWSSRTLRHSENLFGVSLETQQEMMADLF